MKQEKFTRVELFFGIVYANSHMYLFKYQQFTYRDETLFPCGYYCVPWIVMDCFIAFQKLFYFVRTGGDFNF